MSTMHDLRRTDDWGARRIALVVVALVLVSWAGHLSFALPTSYTVSSWSLAWAGFDVLMAALLAATGWLALRRRLGRCCC